MKLKNLGFKELEAAFGELSSAASKGVLRRTGRKALVPFDEAWRARAPHLSWELEQSGGIGSDIHDRRGHHRESEVEVFAGPGNNPQAVQQEFGNQNHPPQPYARPAWEDTKLEVLDVASEELRVEVQQAAQRAQRRALRAK